MTRTVAVVALTPMLVLGCRGSEQPANNQAAAASAPTVPAEPTPAQRAQVLVQRQLGANSGVRFAHEQVFTSAGATIVCGRYQQAGQAPARYIAVGEDDVFVEGRMQPGHMDQAVTEFCRNG